MIKISASHIILYTDCSLKCKFRYFDKIIKPAISIHLAYGSAIHKGFEALNLSLINKETPDLTDVYQAFHDSYEKEINQMGLENDFHRFTLYGMGLKSLEKYFYELLDYEPLEAELNFEVPIIYTDGSICETHIFHGIIDTIIKKKNELIIVDYKTSKEPYKKFKLDTSIQLGLYSYAFRQLIKDGKFKTKKSKEDAIAYYVVLKDYEHSNGDIKMQKKTITDNHIKRVLNITKNVILAEQIGIFVPNYESICNFCEFKKECLEYVG